MINYYNFKKTTIKSVSLFCCLLLFGYSAIAQNLNFTIDTAVDNGTSITETIMDGVDIFVLTVSHSGNEELDNLGGGDLIFFHSATNPLDPHVISITRNGSPANFTLNGVDYDTLGDGTISITNQDDAEISSPTFYTVGAGAISITNMANATDITSFNILPSASGELNDFGFHNINVDVVAACVPPAGTAMFTSQDCSAGEFFAEVNVTDLGGGTPAIFDGTTTTPVAATGVMNFGPYPIGTPVSFTLQHGSDTACDVDLGTISDTCPPPCLSPVATVTVSSQDCAQGEFYIDLNVTDLGSGTPALFDGTTTTPIVATGVTNYGPYTTGTAVNLVLQHGSDASCDLDLGAISDTCSEIIFTIDTAVDDNVTDIITETIIKDGYTFVLTVDHSGNEELDDLGGGDLVFFHSATDPLEPHVLSITRDGTPINFTLKGVDYSAFAPGTISLANQDDAEISSPTLYSGAGAISISNMANATDISSFEIIPNDSDDLNDFGFHNIKVDIIEPCAPAVATAVLATQDCTAQEFSVEINVTDLGNGTPAVFDGTTTTAITVVGSIFLGPYPTGTPVNFTLQHGVDVTCDVDLGAVSDTCPPPPANDECTGAIAVTCGETITGSTVDATDSGNNPSVDVFYSFTDTILQDVSLSLCNSDYDTFIRVFSDCPQMNQIAANDDSNNCMENQSEVTFTAQPNVTYYIMIEGYDNDFGDYEMSVTCIPNVPAPGNDLCANATGLMLAATATGETTAGATDSTVDEDDDTTCQPYTFKSDVWYTFVAPLSGEVTIETETSGASTAASVALYPNCGQLDNESLGCEVGDATGATLAVTGLTSGVTYYIRVWSDGVAARNSQRIEGTFNITASDTATLSTLDFDNDSAFSYYPNPVNTMLTLNSEKEISNVSVFNMLGQEVYKKVPNSLNVDVDMSNLQSGAYFVRVTMDNVTETIRVIKK